MDEVVMGMVVDQVRDKESEKEAYKMDKKVIKAGIKKTDEGSDMLDQMAGISESKGGN